MNLSKLAVFFSLNFIVIGITVLIWPFFIIKNFPKAFKRGWLSWLTAFFMLIIDQWTKIIAVQKISTYKPKVLIPDIFKLEITKNKGAAFGIMENYQWLFISVAFIAIIIFFLLSAKPVKQMKLLYLGYGFLIGGALGNLIDRIRVDYVIDFMHLNGFPVFNVADLSIDAGLLILFWYLLIGERRKKNASSIS